jgi:hypothetical protein
MASSFTANKRIEKPANGDDVDTWDVPVNGNSDIIDLGFGGSVTINVVAASGTVALSATQYRPLFITFSGLLTANVNYQLPSGVGGNWWITNSSTGSFSITISSAGGGTTVVAAQGKRTNVQCDGTNVVTGAASSGANSDITSLSGLTTPLTVAQGGTGVATLTGIPKAAGTAAFVAATAGTDYVKPDTASTFTGTQTFNGTTSALAEILTNAAEVVTISATAATGTIAFYASSQSVIYFTSSAAANWVLNLTFGVGHTFDSVMSAGQSVTVVFMVTQGATAYYNTSVQVDGSTVGVTTKWIGGTPTSGAVSGIDIYSYVVMKTGAATFTVVASVSSAA